MKKKLNLEKPVNPFFLVILSFLSLIYKIS